MNIVQAEYRRVKNLGNYESAEFKMVAVIEEGEDAQNVAEKLRNEVHTALGLNTGKVSKPVEQVKEATTTPVKEEKKATKKKTNKKKVATKKDKEVEVRPTASEIKDLAVKVVKTRGMEVAKTVLSKFDVERTAELVVADYAKAKVEFERALS